MFKAVKYLLFPLVLLVFCQMGYATVYYSQASGNWGGEATWTPVGGPPTCGDTIYIQDGHTVSVVNQQDYSLCGSPITLTISGTLLFTANGKKLRLPCSSGITIDSTGLISSSAGGGGNSNFIELCSVIVWNKDSGDFTGPKYIGSAVLPIELISFEAHANVDRIDLKWITSTEINNDFFTIERSSDGRIWEVIEVVYGAGNSSSILEYFDSDYSPQEGLSYYRLKQTDYDGKFNYSSIVPVRFETRSLTGGTINLFPSPVNQGETMNIEFTAIEAAEVLVVLRDITGKEFYSKIVVNVEEGKLVGIPIDSSIPTGIYLVTASSDNKMYSQKLIVK